MLKFDEQEDRRWCTRRPRPAGARHLPDREVDLDRRAQLKTVGARCRPAVARFACPPCARLVARQVQAHRAPGGQRRGPHRPGDHRLFRQSVNRLMVEIGVGSMSSFKDVGDRLRLRHGPAARRGCGHRAGPRRRRRRPARGAAPQPRPRSATCARRCRMSSRPYRRDVGTGKLMGLWVARDNVTFIQSDGLMTDYDRLGAIPRSATASTIRSGCAATDSTSARSTGRAFPPGREGDARRQPGRRTATTPSSSVERPRECGPVTIEVKFANYKSPQPYSAFDAKEPVAPHAMKRPLRPRRAAGILALAGCTTIPEQDCPRVDWYELGQKDGRAAIRLERIADQPRGLVGREGRAGRAQIPAGRRAGIVEHCQPPNAPRRTRGQRVSRRLRRDVPGAITRRRSRRHAAPRDRAQPRRHLVAESEIRSDKTSDSRRQQLRNDVRGLDAQRVALRDDLVRAERDLDRLMAQAPAPAAPPPPAVPSPRPR